MVVVGNVRLTWQPSRVLTWQEPMVLTWHQGLLTWHNVVWVLVVWLVVILLVNVRWMLLKSGAMLGSVVLVIDYLPTVVNKLVVQHPVG